jgi:CheY-like chemotaxis protein
MVMPAMDGASLIATLHQDYPNMRVIATSGIAATVADTSSEYFLPKPYSAETLLVMMRKALTGKSPATMTINRGESI